MERHTLSKEFVLDSSVIIKWFSNEDFTQNALTIRQKFIAGFIHLACPDLVVYEIANVLRYNKALTEDDVTKSVCSILSLGMDIIVPTKRTIETAVKMAFTYDVTVYDAFFVALAKELNCTLITADKKLFAKVKYLSFVILLENFSLHG